jgi:hypothetical protein
MDKKFPAFNLVDCIHLKYDAIQFGGCFLTFWSVCLQSISLFMVKLEFGDNRLFKMFVTV